MKIEIIITISILLLLFVGFFSSWVSCWWCQERLMKESIRLDWVFSRSLPFSRDFHSLSILYDSWELSWSRRALSNCCFHSHWNLFILMLFKVKFPTFNVNIFAMAVNNLRASAKVLSSRYGEFNKLFKSRNFRYFGIFCRDFWYNQLVSKISPNYLKISTKIYYHPLASSYLNVKHFILSLCCHCGCFSLCYFHILIYIAEIFFLWRLKASLSSQFILKAKYDTHFYFHLNFLFAHLHWIEVNK